MIQKSWLIKGYMNTMHGIYKVKTELHESLKSLNLRLAVYILM